MESIKSEWVTAADGWEIFVNRHPEIGLRPGIWRFHNFLRKHKTALVNADAIRIAHGRHWIAHTERFCSLAFELATQREQVSA